MGGTELIEPVAPKVLVTDEVTTYDLTGTEIDSYVENGITIKE
jgi:hypothetical protein